MRPCRQKAKIDWDSLGFGLKDVASVSNPAGLSARAHLGAWSLSQPASQNSQQGLAVGLVQQSLSKGLRVFLCPADHVCGHLDTRQGVDQGQYDAIRASTHAALSAGVY